jgi:hypothetical protein
MDSSNQGIFNSFSTNKYVSSTQEFLKSNSLVAKVAFFLLTLFIFIILLRFGITLLGYLLGPDGTPRLIDGMVDAKQLMVIQQDPSLKDSITISRSSNANEGIEFTWSVWIFIEELTYHSGRYRCVFYKGNDYAGNSKDTLGLNFPNNAPGLYIAPNSNSLVVMMNTFNVINEEITIDNIPINKWVNVIIRCQNNTLDIYINGTITKSHYLHGVPKQNYGDVYIAPNGGFAGYISNLWYYNYALGTAEIARLVNKGPNTYMKTSNGVNIKSRDYLSLRWFFYGMGDGYNPDMYNPAFR